MSHIKPRARVPSLEVNTFSGKTWKLDEQSPAIFTMIVVYRGLHCPICKSYLRDLDRKVADFVARGVSVIAISSDDRERAETTKREWGIQNLEIGFNLTIPTAREWGLYVSKAIKEGEPAEFAEPGIFLVKPDQTLYASSINTMPFARPPFNDVLAAVDFVVKNNYPARGES